MPLTDHQKAVAFVTLLPGSVCLASSAAFVNDSSVMDWWQNLKRPSWAIAKSNDTAMHVAADLLTMVPLGYATVQIWEKGGGFDGLGSRPALIAYAINNGLALLHIPIFGKKSVKNAFYGLTAIFLNSCAMCYLYYKVDKNAGYMVIPYTLLGAYYCALTRSMWNLNEQDKK